jgi:excisionase family DNA binding protein
MDRMNVQEGASYLGISKHTVRYLLRTGQLPCFRIGRRIVLDRQDLDEFLSRHRQLATANQA